MDLINVDVSVSPELWGMLSEGGGVGLMVFCLICLWWGTRQLDKRLMPPLVYRQGDKRSWGPFFWGNFSTWLAYFISFVAAMGAMKLTGVW